MLLVVGAARWLVDVQSGAGALTTSASIDRVVVVELVGEEGLLVEIKIEKDKMLFFCCFCCQSVAHSRFEFLQTALFMAK